MNSNRPACAIPALVGPQVGMQKVSEYEQNAAECRQKAAQATDLQLKKRLEEMAAVWDMLARKRRQGVVENNPNQS